MRALTTVELEAARADETDHLLTIAEAAAELHVDTTTVQSWIQREWVGVVKIAGLRMVLLSEASEVERWARKKPGRKKVRYRDKGSACRGKEHPAGVY